MKIIDREGLAMIMVVATATAFGALLATTYHANAARQSTEPAALLPACDTLRVHHPDPRRLVRIIDCVTGDTTVERGRP